MSDLIERLVTVLVTNKAEGSIFVGADVLERLGEQRDEFVTECAERGILFAGSIDMVGSGTVALWQKSGSGDMTGCDLFEAFRDWDDETVAAPRRMTAWRSSLAVVA